MNDRDCTRFLQWSLPKLHLHWPGFRKVRSQVCKRISTRMRELNLKNTGEYRSFLEEEPNEWVPLDSFCRITISRFYRDRRVFQALEQELLPDLARRARPEETALSCWSIGCASGEEPYTLALVWEFAAAARFPGFFFSITASDADPEMIDRAQEGCFPMSSLKELPKKLFASGFDPRGNRFCIRDLKQARVNFLLQDIRKQEPEGRFDLILCRNLVFTYFDEKLQREVLDRLMHKLKAGGIFMIGAHEKLPAQMPGLSAWPAVPGVFRKK